MDDPEYHMVFSYVFSCVYPSVRPGRKSNQHTNKPQCEFTSFHFLRKEFSPKILCHRVVPNLKGSVLTFKEILSKSANQS